ncbi:MAG: tRNA preQ1(34) S-adenosylmethionine ribosyltransferase-isomerase QueA [Elusimicrobia bacterium]|nr:tRNA preQ1(34) S-adenosylmethionine ribosyltransferase-isomerase QueA [Elusimicrobiota bacterium]
MKLSEFDYRLPKELIAQEGLSKRDESRLLVLKPDGAREHGHFRDILTLLKKGDLLICNDTRVFPARLIGHKETGGKIDCLLLHSPLNSNHSENIHEGFLRGPKIKPGISLNFSLPNGQPQDKILKAKVLEKVKGTLFKIEFENPDQISSFAILPTPPYIKKPLSEQDRYQTVYSQKAHSLAAPTAGLHFTPDLMEEMKKRGIEFVFLTLHIGIGTFAPIRAEEIENWKMHPEHFTILPETAQKINDALNSGRRVFAVGTSTVRTLESVTENGRVSPQEGWTDLFIYPSYKFKFPYSGMITNFHLPQSTLLLLVCALAGKEKIFSAYEEAIREKYRFFSLGDAMFLLQ